MIIFPVAGNAPSKARVPCQSTFRFTFCPFSCLCSSAFSYATLTLLENNEKKIKKSSECLLEAHYQAVGLIQCILYVMLHYITANFIH